MTKAEFHFIYNESFSKGIAPGIWKEANILPPMKDRKSWGPSPPTDMSALHPASWRECCKTRGWNCNEQTGFQKLRSCEYQILRITQTTSDDFQASKPQRSLMALHDFSKAFNQVWREELLLAPSPKGLPIPFPN